MTTLALIPALFLCSLTTGFVLAFALVVMPGLRTLDDGSFLRAFQVIDGVIQNNQPLFVVMWVGSIVAVLGVLVVGVGTLDGVDRVLLVGGGALYLGGVQLPTVKINIPLNNQVQRLTVEQLDAGALRAARTAFEERWNRWNEIRTGFAALSVGLMLAVLVRL